MPTTTRLQLTEEERLKVRHCLDLLQEAQNLIESAAQELCPVRGFGREWSASERPYHAVKRYWHRVRARLTGLQ